MPTAFVLALWIYKDAYCIFTFHRKIKYELIRSRARLSSANSTLVVFLLANWINGDMSCDTISRGSFHCSVAIMQWFNPSHSNLFRSCHVVRAPLQVIMLSELLYKLCCQSYFRSCLNVVRAPLHVIMLSELLYKLSCCQSPFKSSHVVRAPL